MSRSFFIVRLCFQRRSALFPFRCCPTAPTAPTASSPCSPRPPRSLHLIKERASGGETETEEGRKIKLFWRNAVRARFPKGRRSRLRAAHISTLGQMWRLRLHRSRYDCCRGRSPFGDLFSAATDRYRGTAAINCRALSLSSPPSRSRSRRAFRPIINISCSAWEPHGARGGNEHNIL